MGIHLIELFQLFLNSIVEASLSSHIDADNVFIQYQFFNHCEECFSQVGAVLMTKEAA